MGMLPADMRRSLRMYLILTRVRDPEQSLGASQSRGRQLWFSEEEEVWGAEEISVSASSWASPCCLPHYLQQEQRLLSDQPQPLSWLQILQPHSSKQLTRKGLARQLAASQPLPTGRSSHALQSWLRAGRTRSRQAAKAKTGAGLSHVDFRSGCRRFPTAVGEISRRGYLKTLRITANLALFLLVSFHEALCAAFRASASCTPCVSAA
jgi:hypothetical protein